MNGSILWNKKRFIKLIIFLLFLNVVGLFNGWKTPQLAAETSSEILEIITQGVAYNDSLIKDISFHYTIDYRISEEWLKYQSNRTLSQGNLPAGMVVRDPTREPVIFSGILKAEGDKFFITSTVKAVGDGKILQDKIISFDGITLIRLNLIQDYGDISQGLEFMGRNSIWDPRSFQSFFLDGESLYKKMADKSVDKVFVGKETIDGFPCYCLEVNIPYSNEEGSFVAKKKIWIDPQSGFRVRKTLAFDRKMGRPLTATWFTLKKFGDVWYPIKVKFESEGQPNLPLGPHIIMTLDVNNVSINQNNFGKNTFIADLNKVSRITDFTHGGVTFKTQK